MTNYLSYTFTDSEAFINTYDELPLWSASFGLLLLKHLELKPNITVADIGSGTGFPLLELAARMGSSCKLYGVDPWSTGNARAIQKMKNYGLGNVEIIESSAEKISLGDQSLDLVVSCLGINNFKDPGVVFAECFRLLKAGGKLALTSNLYGHWKEFYSIFYTTLEQSGKGQFIQTLKKDEERRGSVESISKLFSDNGYTVTRYFTDSFEMNFVDGSAFLNHHFVKLGWLSSWTGLFPKEELEHIFSALEHNLNAYARQHQGLKLTVPMAFVEGQKG